MLRTLIHQEFLIHLMSARFFAACVITLLLVVTNTFVLIGTYEERVADYNQKELVNRKKVSRIPTYSSFNLKVERPPTPLSLFSAGLDTRYGSHIEIMFPVVPTLSDTREPLGLKNPHLNLFSQIDLVFIFQMLVSLLALLFAYDAIAGDWEAGTLRLVMSHPVRQGVILFAKYIAAMVCLLLPVLISLLMVMIQSTLAPSLQLGTGDFLRIGGIFLTTSVYLSAFYLIGLLISTTTRRPITSLMLCLFLWVILVLVYPNWSRFTLDPVGDIRAEKISAEKQLVQILEETEREELRFLANSPLKGKPPVFRSLFGEVSFGKGGIGAWHMTFYEIEGELKNPAAPLVSHLRRFHQFAARLRIRNAEKVGLVRQQLAVQTSLRRARWDERFMKLSPASLYRFTTDAWAGTDLDTMIDYIQAAQAYRRILIDYFENKDAFGSLQWFATNQGSIDWSSLPRFRFERPEVDINAQRALPGLFLLFLTNVVLFMVTFLIFIKIEV